MSRSFGKSSSLLGASVAGGGTYNMLAGDKHLEYLTKDSLFLQARYLDKLLLRQKVQVLVQLLASRKIREIA